MTDRGGRGIAVRCGHTVDAVASLFGRIRDDHRREHDGEPRGAAVPRNLFYDLAKNAVARRVWAVAQELRERGSAALGVAPGFMRAERVVEAFQRAARRMPSTGLADRMKVVESKNLLTDFLGEAC